MAAATPTRSQNKADALSLDLTDSQISPMYAHCLANMLEAKKGCPRGSFALRSPRPQTSFVREEGTDSNASSCQAVLAAAEHSPRGFRIDGWRLYEQKSHAPCNTFPSAGTFKKRPAEPDERKFFPNIIRKDKAQQEVLERKCNRWFAIQVMEIEQDDYRKGKKIERRDARVKASEEKYQRDLARMARKREVAAMVEDVEREKEQARIQQEIDGMASER